MRRIPHQVLKILLSDTRPLEYTCLFLLVAWTAWLIFLTEPSSPMFWRIMDYGKGIGLFKLIGVPLALYKATGLLSRNAKSRKNAAWALFTYWFLFSWALYQNGGWHLWHTTFCTVMTFVQAYMLVQKSAVQPRPGDNDAGRNDNTSK